MTALKNFYIKNKIVIITGGAGLLGSTFTEAIAEIKGIPIILDLDKKRSQELCVKIYKNYKIKPLFIKTDITNEVSLKKANSIIIKKFKKIDVLINNAANNPKINNKNDSSLENFSLSRWQKDVDVGLKGSFLCSKIFGKEMTKKKSGVIINISSDLGIISPDQRLYNALNKKPVSYSVVKHGIIGLTKYIATYWSSEGIRSNTLCPGGIFDNQSDEFVMKIKNLIPLKRMAEKNEYKNAIQFLSSDASSYMNGATVVIDGGRSIW
tara:strand:+ start:4046 stop:4843 length:798 start_codon:yes stop_codon:yes gene_type:complete